MCYGSHIGRRLPPLSDAGSSGTEAEANPDAALSIQHDLDDLTTAWSLALQEVEWMSRALCVEVDAELFFPTKPDTGTIALAKRVCRLCDVRSECLGYAVKNRIQHGVWGGVALRQRRTLEAP